MIGRIKALSRKLQGRSITREWPCPRHSIIEEPTFLFIFTPPYSGSTALSKILATASRSTTLNQRAEGQWLIPALCESDRWNPDKFINWSSVRAVWLKRVENKNKKREEPARIVIEKSPPNLLRSEGYMQHFPKHKLIVFNRNPYANCASFLYRQHNPDLKPEQTRIELLKGLARDWIVRSTYIKEIIESHAPLSLTYEEFCKDTSHVCNEISAQIPLLEGISPDTEVKVKDYEPQRISDQNKKQIGLLSIAEREAISQVLSSHEELLNHFGYTKNWQEAVEQGGAGNA